MCAPLLEQINKMGESPVAARLKDSIQFANEPSFQNRITSLFTRVRPDDIQRRLGDPADFEQALRQTRNFFTHPGIKKQPKVLIDTKDLFLFNQRLHAFLRLLMLHSVGFWNELTFEPIYDQSRKWR
jgi:hypothetical protein